MDIQAPVLSRDFQRLYCDPTVYQGFSTWHPVDFSRVLPFQPQDPVADNPRLLAVEAAHLASPTEMNRKAVVEAFGLCHLLPASEVADLKPVLDFFDADFFEFMGEVYATAGMFICALRWYREFITELEARRPQSASDNESVYASVGYCLYSLGLLPEAIAWSKSCIGPNQTADTVNRVLLDYEAQTLGGCVQGIERAASRARYTVSAFETEPVGQITPRLKQAMHTFAPFQEVYLDWIRSDGPLPQIQPEGYPFQAEHDASNLTRHRMNLLFSLCGQADTLIVRGYAAEAKRLLHEATQLEPQAEFISDRLKTLP